MPPFPLKEDCRKNWFERRNGSKPPLISRPFVQTSAAVLLCLANLSLRFISMCRGEPVPSSHGRRFSFPAFCGYKRARDGKARLTRWRSGLNQDRAESAMAFTGFTCKMYGFALFPPSSQPRSLSASWLGCGGMTTALRRQGLLPSKGANHV